MVHGLGSADDGDRLRVRLLVCGSDQEGESMNLQPWLTLKAKQERQKRERAERPQHFLDLIDAAGRLVRINAAREPGRHAGRRAG